MSNGSQSSNSELQWRGDATETEQLQRDLRYSLATKTPAKCRERSITLVDAGKTPVKVIWAVRDHFGLSLADAKRLVLSSPVKIPLPEKRSSRDEVDWTIRDAEWALNAAGAKVETPSAEEWTVMPFQKEFMSLVPRLELDVSFTLIAQIFAGPRDGFSRICMLMPSAPPWESQSQLWEGHWPIGACGIEDALRGDRSPQSYLAASILIRVFGEKGNGWNGQEWTSHSIVASPTDKDWVWVQDEVRCDADMQPRVEISKEGNVLVTFFSVTGLEWVRLVRHRDHYLPGSYRPESDLTVCATGGLGYVY
jgi:ribosomal protein L7/L12